LRLDSLIEKVKVSSSPTEISFPSIYHARNESNASYYTLPAVVDEMNMN